MEATHAGRILSDVDAAVAVTDRDGRVTIWNPAAARLWGVKPERAIGQPVSELGVARELAPLKDALNAVYTARRGTTLDALGVPCDAGTRIVRLRVSPLADESGQLIGAILIGVDVTEERRRLEQLGRQKLAVESLNAALRRQARALADRQRELEEKNALVAAANRAKSDFIANMSHELRTPLNSIRGFCQLLLDPKRSPSEKERREYLEIVERNGTELLALIDDILDLAKADAGRLALEVARVSVEDIARDIVSELAPLAEEKGIGLEVALEAGLCPVETDPRQLARILRNLVANAIKFTHRGGVRLRLSPLDLGGVRVCVIDSGIGIRAEDQERIFEPFEQVDGSHARRYGGTGLGLSIVRRLAGLLGGKIEVASVPGSGSTFTLDVPARAPTPEDRGGEGKSPSDTATALPTPPVSLPRDVSSPPGASPGERRSQERPVVLVADWDERTFRALEPALRTLRMGCGWARGGAEAVGRAYELACEHRLAAIVLSDASGDGGGRSDEVHATLERLRKDPLTAHVPVFLVAEPAGRRGALPRGVSEVFVRPVDATRLAESIAARFHARALATRGTPTARMSSLAERHRRREVERSSQPRSLAGRSVLVVEDNEDSAKLAQLLLEQKGCRVTLAADAGKALALLRAEEHDAVIMDLMLPGLDGYEATRAIRTMPGRSAIPIVAATAAVLPGDRARALEAGCDDIVAKPYDIDVLADRVAAAIEAYRARSAASRPAARTPSAEGAA